MLRGLCVGAEESLRFAAVQSISVGREGHQVRCLLSNPCQSPGLRLPIRLALVISSDYHRSVQLPTLSRSLEDADRFAAYLDGSDLEIAIEELSADRYFPEQFEAALREPTDPPAELIVYFAGYVVTAPGRDPSLILDGERLGAFALPRLRRLLEEMASRVLVVIDAVSIAHDGAEPSAVADAIGNALGRHGALSVLVNVAS